MTEFEHEMEKATRDALLYGDGFVTIDKNGRLKAVPPQEVVITIPRNNPHAALIPHRQDDVRKRFMSEYQNQPFDVHVDPAVGKDKAYMMQFRVREQVGASVANASAVKAVNFNVGARWLHYEQIEDMLKRREEQTGSSYINRGMVMKEFDVTKSKAHRMLKDAESYKLIERSGRWWKRRVATLKNMARSGSATIPKEFGEQMMNEFYKNTMFGEAFRP